MFIKIPCYLKNLHNLSLVYNTIATYYLVILLAQVRLLFLLLNIALQRHLMLLIFFIILEVLRVGNENVCSCLQFSLFMDSEYVHNNDIVTNLPPSSFGI